jgi:hypothetical protein
MTRARSTVDSTVRFLRDEQGVAEDAVRDRASGHRDVAPTDGGVKAGDAQEGQSGMTQRVRTSHFRAALERVDPSLEPLSLFC